MVIDWPYPLNAGDHCTCRRCPCCGKLVAAPYYPTYPWYVQPVYPVQPYYEPYTITTTTASAEPGTLTITLNGDIIRQK